MARRRTRKDKIIAQLRRQVSPTMGEVDSAADLVEVSYSPEKKISKKKSSGQVKQTDDLVSLFSYDPALIRKDLLRTAIFSIIAFIVLIFLYLYL